MNTIFISDNHKYRICRGGKIYKKNGKHYYSVCYVVQIKILFFWITIKSFIVGSNDCDLICCQDKALKLYNTIING